MCLSKCIVVFSTSRSIPTKIGMFVDYSWFVCLALTGKFLPTCYVLQITYKNIPTDTK